MRFDGFDSWLLDKSAKIPLTGPESSPGTDVNRPLITSCYVPVMMLMHEDRMFDHLNYGSEPNRMSHF